MDGSHTRTHARTHAHTHTRARVRMESQRLTLTTHRGAVVRVLIRHGPESGASRALHSRLVRVRGHRLQHRGRHGLRLRHCCALRARRLEIGQHLTAEEDEGFQLLCGRMSAKGISR